MGMRFSGVDFDALEQLAKDHPDSIYAAYAKFAIANSLIWKNTLEFHDPDSEKLQRGLELLQQVLRDPRFVLDEQARELLWQARIHQEKIAPVPYFLRREFPWSRVEPAPGGYRCGSSDSCAVGRMSWSPDPNKPAP
jgi:hypothetical protein